MPMTMSGRKHSPETIARMREAAKRRLLEKPHTAPPHVGQKPFLGKTHTPEAREKISQSKQGENNPHYGLTNELSPNWKGDDVGYWGIHSWVQRNYGKANHCEDCGDMNAPRYEWANISGQYKRDISDWKQLCKKCHNDMDGVNVQQQRRRV